MQGIGDLAEIPAWFIRACASLAGELVMLLTRSGLHRPRPHMADEYSTGFPPLFYYILSTGHVRLQGKVFQDKIKIRTLMSQAGENQYTVFRFVCSSCVEEPK